jgi:hypothetical protein
LLNQFLRIYGQLNNQCVITLRFSDQIDARYGQIECLSKINKTLTSTHLISKFVYINNSSQNCDPLVEMAKEVAITAIIDKDSRDKFSFSQSQMIAMIHLKINMLLF